MAKQMTLTELAEFLTDEELAERIAIEEKLRELDKYDWELHARPEQLPPPGDWLIWLIMSGRGWGKTRTGAEWIKTKARATPNSRWAIVAPTFRDARDTCVEGESGLLSVVPPSEVTYWNRSFGQLRFKNGSQVQCFGATEPDRLRGPQHHGVWGDELASWPYAETWDQIQFGNRLGAHPQTVITTTPRPTKLVRSLHDRPDVVVTRGNTFDNASNLAPGALAELKARYEGTRIGRQELYAELLTDNEGALWRYEMIQYKAVDCSDGTMFDQRLPA